MFDNVLKIMLFLSAVFYNIGFGSTHNANNTFFCVFVASLFVASLFSKQQRELPYKLKLFILAIFCLYGINLYLSNFSVKIFNNMTPQILIVFAFVLIVKYCCNVKECAKFIVYGLIASLLLSICQILGYTPIFNEGGFFGNQPRFGPYLAITIPLVFLLDNIYIRSLIVIGCLYVALIGNPECTVLLSIIVISVWLLYKRFMRA